MQYVPVSPQFARFNGAFEYVVGGGREGERGPKRETASRMSRWESEDRAALLPPPVAAFKNQGTSQEPLKVSKVPNELKESSASKETEPKQKPSQKPTQNDELPPVTEDTA